MSMCLCFILVFVFFIVFVFIGVFVKIFVFVFVFLVSHLQPMSDRSVAVLRCQCKVPARVSCVPAPAPAEHNADRGNEEKYAAGHPGHLHHGHLGHLGHLGHTQHGQARVAATTRTRFANPLTTLIMLSNHPSSSPPSSPLITCSSQ